MTRRGCLGAAAVLAIVAASGACTRDDDPVINARVQANVNNAVPADSKVEATVSHGVVTLSGLVRSPATRDRAVAAAKQVEGVKQVNDQVEVTPPATAAPSNTVAPR